MITSVAFFSVISMFRDQPMQAILAACSLAASSSNTSELHYKFLKTLCDLLCSLGIHLAEIWLNIANPPENFTLYLDAVAEFFQHPSMVNNKRACRFTTFTRLF